MYSHNKTIAMTIGQSTFEHQVTDILGWNTFKPEICLLRASL